MSEQSDRVQFLHDLAQLVDRETDALQQHATILSSNPQSAEVLEDARKMAMLIATAGDDFCPDPEMAEKITLALPESPTTKVLIPGAADAEGDPPQQARSAESSTARASFPAPRREGPDGIEEAQLVAPKTGGKRGMAIGLGVVALAGVAFAASVLLKEPPPPPPTPVEVAPPPPRNALKIRLVAVLGGADSVVSAMGADGKPGGALEVGSMLAAGEGLHTGPRTRALLELETIGRVIAAGNTQLLVDQEREGHLVLSKGRLLVDAHGAATNVLTIETPAGMLRIVDGLVHARLRDDHVELEVMRGKVQLEAEGGKAATATTGQHARMTVGETPRISTVWGMWPELDFADFGVSGGDDQAAPRPPQPQQLVAGVPELTWTLEAPDPTDVPVDAGIPEPPELPRLTKLEVEIDINGHTAHTTLTHTFRPTTTDGTARYRLRLPPDATWTGLSIEADGQWQPATPVRKPTRGRPGAQPVGEGEEGILQVDGIAVVAEQALRLRVEYLQIMPATSDGRRYVLPLPRNTGESITDGFQLLARSEDGRTLRAPNHAASFDRKTGLKFSADDFKPDGDFIVEVQGRGPNGELRVWGFLDEAQPAIARDGAAGYAVFSLRPALPAADSDAPQGPLLIVVDTSQSMAGAPLASAAAIVTALVDAVHPERPVQLVACDRVCSTDRQAPGTAGELRAKGAPEWITQRGAAGASDMLATLAYAHKQINPGAQDTATTLIYLGDGAPTLGSQDADVLAKQVTKLVYDGRATFSTVALGGTGDALRLATLARAGGGHHVRAHAGVAASTIARELLLALGRTRLSDVKISLPQGVTGELQGLPSLRDGQEITLLARLDQRLVSGELILTGTALGKPFKRSYPLQFEASTSDGNRFVGELWKHWATAPGNRWARTEPAAAEATRWTLKGATVGLLQAPARTGGSPRGISVLDVATLASDRLELELSSLAERTPFAGEGSSAPTGRAPRAKRRSWVLDDTGPYEALLRAVDDTRAASEGDEAGEPQRDAHVRALARLGNLERMRKFLDEWRRAAPRSPLALLHTADLRMQEGQPEAALRMLEGIIDLRPNDVGVHERLARAYERSGRTPQACAHLQALARLAPAAPPGRAPAAYIRALTCLDSTGQTDAAQRMRTSIGGTPLGARVVALDAKGESGAATKGSAPAPATVDSDPNRLRIHVTWEPEQDLDVCIVTAEGQTLSWIGGRPDLQVAGARSLGGERLELDALPGIYQLSVHRRSGSDSVKIKGEVSIDLPDGRRRTQFELLTDRRDVARIVIER